jgi:hypothetical protein
MRRFDRRDKETAPRFQRRAKCAGEKPHTGAQRRLRFFVGQARYCGRSAYNPVMRRLILLYILSSVYIFI